MDRLGRNAIDVATTVAKLADMGVRVHRLALGGVNLTSPAGKMTMGVINAVAQFERDLLVERTHSGLTRAKAEGGSGPAVYPGWSAAARRSGSPCGRVQRVRAGTRVSHQPADYHAGAWSNAGLGSPMQRGHGSDGADEGCLLAF